MNLRFYSIEPGAPVKPATVWDRYEVTNTAPIQSWELHGVGGI
jgi:hypothetical protein